MPKIVYVDPPPQPLPKQDTKAEAEARRRARALLPDQIVVSESGAQYVVLKMLGTGGFGDVYQVASVKHPSRVYAMKTEGNKVDKSQKIFLRLKVETVVYQDIMKTPDDVIDKSHYVRLIDKGITHAFKYCIMDLAWKPLDYVIESVLEGKVSAHGKISIARQTLGGIEGLHKIGYIHRDIKPGNYVVGLPPNDNIIYTLDFGIAKEFRDATGNVRVPRERVMFMGTLKYASIAGLEDREQGQKDDIEPWIYMMIELYDRKNMAWADLGWTNVEKCVQLRRKLFKDMEKLDRRDYRCIPRAYMAIIARIGKMKYAESVDFQLIYADLESLVKYENIDMSLPLDWVGKYKEIMKKRREKERKEKEREKRKEKEKKEKERRRKQHVTMNDDTVESKTPKIPDSPEPHRKKESRSKDHKRSREKKSRKHKTESDSVSGKDSYHEMNSSERAEFRQWREEKKRRERMDREKHTNDMMMTFADLDGGKERESEDGGKRRKNDDRELTAKEIDERKVEAKPARDNSDRKKNQMTGESKTIEFEKFTTADEEPEKKKRAKKIELPTIDEKYTTVDEDPENKKKKKTIESPTSVDDKFFTVTTDEKPEKKKKGKGKESSVEASKQGGTPEKDTTEDKKKK